jgi:heptaprenyl diphosphate synthase
VSDAAVADLFEPIAGRLNEVERRLWSTLEGDDPEVRAPSVHLLSAGGKRLRPAVVLMAAWAGDGGDDTAVDVATASELIHMATLVHDDVIDDAQIRRGQPTVNARWNTGVSVLVGDQLFARAFQLLAGTARPQIVSAMSAAVEAMARGEIRQMLDRNRPRLPSEQEYLTRIGEKSALFIALCARAGGLAGHLGEAALRRLYAFGYSIGLAFQIVDDLLDFESAPTALGKAVGADLSSGVVTLPVIHAISRDAGGQRRLDEWVEAARSGETTVVRQALEQSGSLGYARQLAERFAAEARAALVGFPPPVTEAFSRLSAFVVARTV